MRKLLTILMMTVMFVALGTNETNAASANITNLYFQHNQFFNGNKGMYVRYGFNVSGLRGRAVRAVVTLYKSNGKKIYYNNGSVVQYTLNFTPGYDTTYYNDCWTFFPYGSMNLSGGRTDCYAMVRIYGPNSKALTSKKITFWLTR